MSLVETLTERTFDTAASVQKSSDVALDSTDPDKLVSYEVCIMRRGNVVFREWSRHVLAYSFILV
jgi:hypothetical protein